MHQSKNEGEKTLQRSLFYCLSKLGKSKCAVVVVVVRGNKKYGLLKISKRAFQLFQQQLQQQQQQRANENLKFFAIVKAALVLSARFICNFESLRPKIGFLSYFRSSLVILIENMVCYEPI